MTFMKFCRILFQIFDFHEKKYTTQFSNHVLTTFDNIFLETLNSNMFTRNPNPFHTFLEQF